MPDGPKFSAFRDSGAVHDGFSRSHFIAGEVCIERRSRNECILRGCVRKPRRRLGFSKEDCPPLGVLFSLTSFFGFHILQEGTANYFKGLMLILCYLIVAASFYVHVDPELAV